MRRQNRCIAALCALALLLALCACGAPKPAPTPAQTQAPAQTDAPAQTGAPAQADTPAQTAAPAQSETPTASDAPAPAASEAPAQTEPPTQTEPPAPALTLDADTLSSLEGLYALTRAVPAGATSYDGDDGGDDGDWLLLRRDGTADYYGTTGDGTFREWRGMAFVAEGGALRVLTPDDFLAAGLTLAPDGAGVLTGQLEMGDFGAYDCRFERWDAPVAGFGGRALTDAELAALNADFDGMSFCTSVYACPEEIDWQQVCYDGAGIGIEPSERLLQEYIDDGGWGELDIEAIPDDALRRLVWQSTLTSYDLARRPLWPGWFRSSDDVYIFEHGDTNAIPVEFTAGQVEGDLYRLSYLRSNFEQYEFEPEIFVLTARIRNGHWQYISNLPADWNPAPAVLATVAYWDDLDAAKALNDIVAVTDEPAGAEHMEPYGWGWAVVTAQSDGVRWIVEGAEDYEDVGLNVRVPGECVGSGVLDAGQAVAVRTNQPWHTAMRVTVTRGGLWGEYVFGSDNYKHLLNGDVRRIVAHDFAGEGCGAQIHDETGLANFLCTGGAWALLDAGTDELVGSINFFYYRNLEARGEDFSLVCGLDYERCDARPSAAPDVIVLRYSESWGDAPALEGLEYRDVLGDYQLWYTQLDGEQVLTLRQASEGAGILSALFPQADEGGGAFTLHRWIGAAEMEGQG